MSHRLAWTAVLLLAAALVDSARGGVDWDEEGTIRGVDLSKGSYEGWQDRLLDAFGHRELIERGDGARILWRRAMGPHGGYNDMAAPRGPAGLELTQAGDKIFVRGGNFRLFWWTGRGGEICDIRQFDGNYWIPAIHHKVTQTIGLVGTPHQEQIPVGFRSFRADTFPNFVIECPCDYAGNTPLYLLGEDKDARFNVRQPAKDEVDIDVTGRPATFLRQRSPVQIRQKYRIFQEGVVLCDFTVGMREHPRGQSHFRRTKFGTVPRRAAGRQAAGFRQAAKAVAGDPRVRHGRHPERQPLRRPVRGLSQPHHFTARQAGPGGRAEILQRQAAPGDPGVPALFRRQLCLSRSQPPLVLQRPGHGVGKPPGYRGRSRHQAVLLEVRSLFATILL